MSDDYNSSFDPDEGAERDGQRRPRSGMPPVTGSYIERGRDPEASRLAASQGLGSRDTIRPVQSRRTQAIALVALIGLIALSALIPLITGGSGSSRPSSGSSNSQNPFTNQSLPEMCAGPIAAVLESRPSDSAVSFGDLCDDIEDDGSLNGSSATDE